MLPTGELNRVPSIPVTSNFGWSNWLHDQMPTSHNWRMPKREEGIDNIFHNLTITSTTVEVVLKEWMEAAGITKQIGRAHV